MLSRTPLLGVLAEIPGLHSELSFVFVACTFAGIDVLKEP